MYKLLSSCDRSFRKNCVGNIIILCNCTSPPLTPVTVTGCWSEFFLQSKIRIHRCGSKRYDPVRDRVNTYISYNAFETKKCIGGIRSDKCSKAKCSRCGGLNSSTVVDQLEAQAFRKLSTVMNARIAGSGVMMQPSSAKTIEVRAVPSGSLQFFSVHL